MMNSSPPRRAAVSSSRRQFVSRSATAVSSRSPMAWPSESLTFLKRSRSRNSTAILPSLRCARAIACADAVGEQRAVGQAGQRVVVRHVHDALVGETPLGDFGLQSGVDAGELERALLDALLERALRPAQRALGRVALPVLALDHAVGVAHDHEQHAVEHAKDRKHAQRPPSIACARCARETA